jgi:hypothetical protein
MVIKQRIQTLLLFVALACALLIAPLGTSAAVREAPAPAPTAQLNPDAIPVTGSTADGGTFAGTLALTSFAVQNGQLVGLGTLSGTLRDAVGNDVGTVTAAPVTWPVASAIGSCDILNLVLGPLDLNLLGLKVHLNQVVLDIVAQSGAGNLLGNLLCAVANLLNVNGPLSSLVLLLNQILALL